MSLNDYIWPIEPKYKVLEHDKYGLREKHMILKKPRWHSGFDITAKTETPVRAATDGIILASGLDEKIVSGSANWNERYGIKVEILDLYKRRLVYAHLRKVLVEIGQEIKQGDIIGLSGCSGGARIPHLHFEVRIKDTCHSGEENTIDPLIILPKRNLLLLEKHFDEEPYNEIWEKCAENNWELTDDDIPYAYSRKLIR
ncbi:MAG: M23 family metallopeptidase [Bacilli bacterium]|nr:M23 family metallopeptidase [Bacilli bacterium]